MRSIRNRGRPRLIRGTTTTAEGSHDDHGSCRAGTVPASERDCAPSWHDRSAGRHVVTRTPNRVGIATASCVGDPYEPNRGMGFRSGTVADALRVHSDRGGRTGSCNSAFIQHPPFGLSRPVPDDQTAVDSTVWGTHDTTSDRRLGERSLGSSRSTRDGKGMPTSGPSMSVDPTITAAVDTNTEPAGRDSAPVGCRLGNRAAQRRGRRTAAPRFRQRHHRRHPADRRRHRPGEHLHSVNAILGTLLVVVLATGEYRDALFGIVLVTNALKGPLGQDPL